MSEATQNNHTSDLELEASIPSVSGESSRIESKAATRKLLLIGGSVMALLLGVVFVFTYVDMPFTRIFKKSKADQTKVSPQIAVKTEVENRDIKNESVNADGLNAPKKLDTTGIDSNNPNANNMKPTEAQNAKASSVCSAKKLVNGVLTDVPVACTEINGSQAANGGVYQPQGTYNSNAAQNGSEKPVAPFNRYQVGVLLASNDDSSAARDALSRQGGIGQGVNLPAGAMKPLDVNEVINGYKQSLPAGIAGATGNGQMMAQAGGGGAGGQQGGGALDGMLTSSKTPMVKATKLPDMNFLIRKGDGFDCVMDGAIEASVAGEQSCTISNDVFSSNGVTKLVEKGSKAFLEFRAANAIGQTRFPVLVSSITTPYGIDIPLDSLAHDKLGESGASGYVDNHWGERIGAALLISWVSDYATYKTVTNAPAGSGGGSMAYQQSSNTAAGIPAKILDSTLNIKPTILKRQGEVLHIKAARHIWFGDVYKLEKSK
jgi:type IV secretory pathway VirB10-like protein